MLQALCLPFHSQDAEEAFLGSYRTPCKEPPSARSPNLPDLSAWQDFWSEQGLWGSLFCRHLLEVHRAGRV